MVTKAEVPQKRNKIIYWIATLWLALGMVSTGIVQIIKMEDTVEIMTNLGYPAYFITILGTWKILGVIAVLIPRHPLVKEWAYAGFFFIMSGAVISHGVNGDSVQDFFGPTLLLILTIISWYFRPANRKIVSFNQVQK